MALLITYSYLRTECDIDDNIENSKLDNPIKKAQDSLKFMLGNAFYAELVSQNNSNSLTTDNQALYDPYIKQYLAWQAYEKWLIRSGSYTTKIGMRVFREENSDPIPDKQFGELIREAKESTQGYKGALLSFLRAEQTADTTKYPLYTNKDLVSMSGGFHVTPIKKRNTKYRENDDEIFYNG